MASLIHLSALLGLRINGGCAFERTNEKPQLSDFTLSDYCDHNIINKKSSSPTICFNLDKHMCSPPMTDEMLTTPVDDAVLLNITIYFAEYAAKSVALPTDMMNLARILKRFPQAE